MANPSNRTEQDILDMILKPYFGKRLIKSAQEERLFVFHPEVAPKGYTATVDNYYEVYDNDGNIIHLAINLHGSWHVKKHVQHWDDNNRITIPYSGYHYVELHFHDLAEHVPSLYRAAQLCDSRADPIETGRMIVNAGYEVIGQIITQLCKNRTRNVNPKSIIHEANSFNHYLEK